MTAVTAKRRLVKKLEGGTAVYEEPTGLIAINDDGVTAWELDLRDEARPCLSFRSAGGERFTLGGPSVDDPVLGPCWSVRDPNGAELTRCSWFDLAQPTHIPALRDPAAVPSAAALPLMASIAALALVGGAERLHYIGPWPTGALFDTLLANFCVDGDASDAWTAFQASQSEAFWQSEVVEPSVAFAPAPLCWRWQATGPTLGRRSVLERVWFDQRWFVRDSGVARFSVHQRSVVLEQWLVGTKVATLGELDPDGVWTPDAVGLMAPTPAFAPFPDRLRPLVEAAIVQRAPGWAAPLLRDVLASAAIRFVDLGLVEARLSSQEGSIELHVGHLHVWTTRSAASIVSSAAHLIEGPAWELVARRLRERARVR